MSNPIKEMKEMNKKDYISPSMHVFWIGLDKRIAITVGGVETSTPRTVKEQNMMDTGNFEASSNAKSSNIWDEEW